MVGGALLRNSVSTEEWLPELLSSNKGTLQYEKTSLRSITVTYKEIILGTTSLL